MCFVSLGRRVAAQVDFKDFLSNDELLVFHLEDEGSVMLKVLNEISVSIVSLTTIFIFAPYLFSLCPHEYVFIW